MAVKTPCRQPAQACRRRAAARSAQTQQPPLRSIVHACWQAAAIVFHNLRLRRQCYIPSAVCSGTTTATAKSNCADCSRICWLLTRQYGYGHALHCMLRSTWHSMVITTGSPRLPTAAKHDPNTCAVLELYMAAATATATGTATGRHVQTHTHTPLDACGQQCHWVTHTMVAPLTWCQVPPAARCDQCWPSGHISLQVLHCCKPRWCQQHSHTRGRRGPHSGLRNACGWSCCLSKAAACRFEATQGGSYMPAAARAVKDPPLWGASADRVHLTQCTQSYTNT
jgi:hypothetical protein